MAAADDFEGRLDVILDFVERIGDEKISSIKGETGEGDLVEGFQCVHGSHQYQVVTSDAWEHISIQYTFSADAIWFVHNNMSSYEDSAAIRVSNEEAQKARRELESELKGYPSVEKREMLLNLKQILSREGCGVDFDTISEPYNIHGFSVTKKLYPYKGEFYIGDFEKSVQNVINFGWTAKDLILEFYGLGLDPPSGPTGFHSP